MIKRVSYTPVVSSVTGKEIVSRDGQDLWCRGTVGSARKGMKKAKGGKPFYFWLSIECHEQEGFVAEVDTEYDLLKKVYLFDSEGQPRMKVDENGELLEEQMFAYHLADVDDKEDDPEGEYFSL